MYASLFSFIFFQAAVVYQIVSSSDPNSLICYRRNNSEPLEGKNVSKDAKCYVKCILQRIGFLLDNGEMDVNAVLTVVHSLDSYVATNANRTLYSCLAKVDRSSSNSTCDTEYGIALCWLEPMDLFFNKAVESLNVGPLYSQLANNGTRLLSALTLSAMLIIKL